MAGLLSCLNDPLFPAKAGCAAPECIHYTHCRLKTQLVLTVKSRTETKIQSDHSVFDAGSFPRQNHFLFYSNIDKSFELFDNKLGLYGDGRRQSQE